MMRFTPGKGIIVSHGENFRLELELELKKKAQQLIDPKSGDSALYSFYRNTNQLWKSGVV